MVYDRVQLNSLIFHNQVMLPRTSPGFGEVSLAVAELQGGDPGKAAAFAEAAVAKDSGLAAGWLAKATADVFAASSANLRVERAMFCLERAFECAPECRRNMTEFFVTNLLAHYLSLVCSAASAHLQEANRNKAVSSTAFGHARSLDFTALIAGITAFCAKRESTRIVSGLTAVAAYGEAAVQRNHALAHWDAADNHVTMATMHVEPAYQLLWIAGQMLKLETLPENLLGPMVEEFTRLLTGATDKQLERLRTTLEEPMWSYFNSGTLDGMNPANRALEAEYAKARGPMGEEEEQFLITIRVDIDNQRKTGGDPSELKEKWGPEIARFMRGLDAPHPHCQPLLDFLDRILPGVRETEAYQLLASPRTALARVIGPQAPIPDAPSTNLALSVVLEPVMNLKLVF